MAIKQRQARHAPARGPPPQVLRGAQARRTNLHREIGNSAEHDLHGDRNTLITQACSIALAMREPPLFLLRIGCINVNIGDRNWCATNGKR